MSVILIFYKTSLPSLAKQLPLLKACQDKAVIFCADGALSMLEKEGIVPDYVTNLDFTDLAMKFFQNKENKTSLNILSCATYPNLVHFLDNKSVILRDDPLCPSIQSGAKFASFLP